MIPAAGTAVRQVCFLMFLNSLLRSLSYFLEDEIETNMEIVKRAEEDYKDFVVRANLK